MTNPYIEGFANRDKSYIYIYTQKKINTKYELYNLQIIQNKNLIFNFFDLADLEDLLI